MNFELREHESLKKFVIDIKDGRKPKKAIIYVKKYEELQERLTKCDKVRKPSDKVKKLKESSSRNSDFQWF